MRTERLLLDANLLVLFIVGYCNPRYVSAHKKLSNFQPEDFNVLASFIKAVDEVVFSPNVLTECSNLARHIAEPAKSEIAVCFRALVLELGEVAIPSKDAVRRDEFLRLGLADCVLLEQCSDDALLLTDDKDLHNAARSLGARSIHFAELLASSSL